MSSTASSKATPAGGRVARHGAAHVTGESTGPGRGRPAPQGADIQVVPFTCADTPRCHRIASRPSISAHGTHACPSSPTSTSRGIPIYLGICNSRDSIPSPPIPTLDPAHPAPPRLDAPHSPLHSTPLRACLSPQKPTDKWNWRVGVARTLHASEWLKPRRARSGACLFMRVRVRSRGSVYAWV